MAISVNWPTRNIFVPKADTVLVGTDPVSGREIRSFDTVLFHKNLRIAEESSDGRGAHLRTHDYTETLYAPDISMINAFTVEFEDGTWRVVLNGSNNNIHTVTVVNSVAVEQNNSAGNLALPQLIEVWRDRGLDAANPKTIDENTSGTSYDESAGGVLKEVRRVGDSDGYNSKMILDPIAIATQGYYCGDGVQMVPVATEGYVCFAVLVEGGGAGGVAAKPYPKVIVPSLPSKVSEVTNMLPVIIAAILVIDDDY